MGISRRAALMAGLSTSVAPQLLWAQRAWPARPFKLVVPFPPGGLMDNMARLIGPRLSKEFGQPVVIENKAGAGGNVGAAEVARATGDGYTLLMASTALTISPAIYETLPYKPEQISIVALLGRVPNVLLVNPRSGIKSVQELIDRAKAAPGKLNYGSNGNGTSIHLSAELFKSETGTQITHVPYRGSAAAVTALLAGEVDFIFENLPNVVSQIKAGTLVALAVTTHARSKVIPQVPTLYDSGMREMNVSAWYGVGVPASTPAAVVARIDAPIEKLSRDTQLVQQMQALGADLAFLREPAVSSFVSADAIKWKRVATAAKIKAS